MTAEEDGEALAAWFIVKLEVDGEATGVTRAVGIGLFGARIAPAAGDPGGKLAPRCCCC